MNRAAPILLELATWWAKTQTPMTNCTSLRSKLTRVLWEVFRRAPVEELRFKLKGKQFREPWESIPSWQKSKCRRPKVGPFAKDLLQVQKVRRVLSSQGGNKAGEGTWGEWGRKKKKGPRDFPDGPWLRLCVSTVVGLIPDEGSLMLHSKATEKEGPRMQPCVTWWNCGGLGSKELHWQFRRSLYLYREVTTEGKSQPWR